MSFKDDFILVSNLDQVRKDEGITQLELSKITGISKNSISSIENGVFRPSLFHALLISKAVHHFVDDLFWLESSSDDDNLNYFKSLL